MATVTHIIDKNLPVYATGNQIISGVKTFAARPTVNGTGFLLSGEAGALPSTIVYTTGNQNISGVKTFLNNVQVLGTGIFNALDLNNIDTISLSGVDVQITNGNVSLTNTPTVNGNLVLTGVDLTPYATISNLIATGNTLNNKINSLSGVSVLTFGNQGIYGNKTFYDNISINNLTVTGTQTIANISNTNVASNYILLNITGGAVDGGTFFVTGDGLTGINDNGAIIGYSKNTNKFKFGTGSRSAGLSLFKTIAAQEDLNTLSGNAVLIYGDQSINGVKTFRSGNFDDLILNSSDLGAPKIKFGNVGYLAVDNLDPVYTLGGPNPIVLDAYNSSISLNGLSFSFSAYDLATYFGNNGEFVQFGLKDKFIEFFNYNPNITSVESNAKYYFNSGVTGHIPIDSQVVHNTGNETINGIKSFQSGSFDLLTINGQTNDGDYSARINFQDSNFGSIDVLADGNFKLRSSAGFININTSAAQISTVNSVYELGQTLYVYKAPAYDNASVNWFNKSITFSDSLDEFGSNFSNTIYYFKSGVTGHIPIDSEVVHNTGNETINGIKTFASRPTVNGTGVLLSGEAGVLPNTIVYTTGNQTISGIKTFATGIIAPNLVYNTGNQTIVGNKIFKNNIQIGNSQNAIYSDGDDNLIISGFDNTPQGMKFILANNINETSITFDPDYHGLVFNGDSYNFLNNRPTVNGTGVLLIGESGAAGGGISFVSPPATANTVGTSGQMALDQNYVYFCVSTNTWKRTALASW